MEDCMKQVKQVSKLGLQERLFYYCHLKQNQSRKNRCAHRKHTMCYGFLHLVNKNRFPLCLSCLILFETTKNSNCCLYSAHSKQRCLTSSGNSQVCFKTHPAQRHNIRQINTENKASCPDTSVCTAQVRCLGRQCGMVVRIQAATAWLRLFTPQCLLGISISLLYPVFTSIKPGL